VAHQDRAVDVTAAQVVVAVAAAVVTGLQDDVDALAERLEEVEEDVEQLLGGDGGPEDRKDDPGLGVAEAAQALPLDRDDGHVRAGPDGVGEKEVAVALLAQVRRGEGRHGTIGPRGGRVSIVRGGQRGYDPEVLSLV
jgi:hypothetical protein